ncbi:MAG: sigma-70 family RNA polymerase sigma factor [Bryobacterales bacterium]|nr:sigma-70 family RNA polymerase sigma factor [Bryobacterales bacterium]
MNLHSFDREYVDQLVAGNPEVERHFTNYFGDLLYIKLRSRVRSPQLREDIAQETFLRVFSFLRRNRGLDHPERLGAFVNTVCSNIVLEQFRAEGRSSELPDHLADPPDPTAGSESRLVTEERKQQVRRILESLPEKDRILLRKVFLEEEDKDEVCREMNVDRDYLRVLLHRAKARFRQGFLKTRAVGFALLTL